MQLVSHCLCYKHEWYLKSRLVVYKNWINHNFSTNAVYCSWVTIHQCKILKYIGANVVLDGHMKSEWCSIYYSGSWSVCICTAGRKRRLMKEDPNYSCSEEPGGEISNPISLNLPATAGPRPIRKHNLDGSRWLERSPKEDDELLYTGNCIWHHLSPDADSSGSRGDVATCLHLVMMTWCQTFLICFMDLETHLQNDSDFFISQR